jgi:hypothetical protein
MQRFGLWSLEVTIIKGTHLVEGGALPESPTDIFPSRHPRERGREEQPLVRREPTLEEVASEEGGVADDLKKMLP